MDDYYSKLWRRYAENGDEAAFTEVYEQLRGKIVRRLASNEATRRNAEDIAEQIFLEVIAHREDFLGNDSPFEAWLFTRVRSRTIDYARHQIVHNRAFVAPVLDPEDDRSLEELAGTHATQEQNLIVHSAMEAVLPRLGDEGKAFRLRHVLGLSYDEIAETLGISPEAVTTRIHRAKIRLQEYLSPQTAR